MKFKYLGTEVTSNGAVQSEVQQQANKAARMSGCLNDMIWKNKCLRLETKVRIYKLAVKQIPTYSIKTRADICKTKKKKLLDTTKMNTLKKIVGNTE
jgi:hypothetical protein